MNAQEIVTFERRQALWAGVILLLLASLLYWFTLDTGFQPEELVGGDLITHQYAQVQARPSNAPGYPLYTMGGWLWFHGLRSLMVASGVQLPNPIPLLSSYSTLWALAALALLYAILCRLTRSERHPAGNWQLAWLLTAFYGVTYFFWYYATTTEQYSSAIAQTLAIIYVYLLWQAAVQQAARPPQLPATPAAPTSSLSGAAPRLLILLALLCGLSLAHMLTVAFIVPPLVLAVLWEKPAVLRNWRLVLACVGAALLPLLSYLYVYVRGAAHPEWWGAGDWRSAQEWFWSFVSTAQGRDELSRGLQPTCAFFANGFPELIWQELSMILVVAGVIGIAWLQRKLAFVLYATLALYLLFDWMYRCGNWYQVILPAYPLLLLGVAALADGWERHWVGSRRWLAYAPIVLLAGLVVWRFAGSWERADSRDRSGDSALDRASVLLGQPLPAGAGLFAPVNEALALDYLIRIWGVQPQVSAVSSGEAGERLRHGGVVLSTFAAAPVLLAELPQGLPTERRAFSPDWLLLRTAGDGAAGAPAVTLNHPVLPGLTLLGYRVQPSPQGAPVVKTEPGVDVTLVWEFAGEWPAGVGVSLRPTHAGAFIVDPARTDGGILQRDAGAPLGGLYVVDSLGRRPVVDAHRVLLPSGADGLALIVYQATGEGFVDLFATPLELPTE